MTEKIFKGIRQVTADQFNEAKESGLLASYLWFVRTEVLADDEEANTPENDNYDIYFGSKQYGHFRAGELDAIRAQIESLNGNITAINDALEGLVDLAEKAQAAIAQEVEERKAADEVIRSEFVTADNAVREELTATDEAIRGEFAAADDKIREEFAASQELLRTAYEQADADMGARITVIEGDDTGKSMREVAVDELAKQLLGEEKAEDNFKTLQELAAWLEQHPEDVTAMNAAIEQNAKDIVTNANAIAKNAEDVAKNTAAITKNAEGIVELNNKVGDLEAADTALDGKIAAVNKRVDEIPVIETLTVNGVDATISEGIAEVEINGDNIGVGSNVPGYESNASISTVLKGIIESFAAASDGTIVSVSSGDDAIKINTENPVTPVISLNTEARTEETVTDGHIEIVKGTNGIYGVMYYSGNDVE
jgi:hypothetical protein